MSAAWPRHRRATWAGSRGVGLALVMAARRACVIAGPLVRLRSMRANSASARASRTRASISRPKCVELLGERTSLLGRERVDPFAGLALDRHHDERATAWLEA